MTMRLSLILPALLTLLGGAATAQESPAAASAPASAAASSPAAIGDTTRQWLELQRSNAQAGKNHPMNGEVASLVHQRYVDSFRAPRQSGSTAAPRREGGAAGAEPRNH